MHVVLLVPVHLDSLGRPVLDVAGAVNNREVVTYKVEHETNMITPGKSEKMHVV